MRIHPTQLELEFAKLVSAIAATEPIQNFEIDANPTDYEVAANHVKMIGFLFANYIEAVMAEAECSFPGLPLSNTDDVDILRDQFREFAGQLNRDAESLREMACENARSRRDFLTPDRSIEE